MQKERQEELEDFLKEGWEPRCKQDVVELLMAVQVGNVSCRKASDILFPEFKITPFVSP